MGLRDRLRSIIVVVWCALAPAAWAVPDREMSFPNSFVDATTAHASQVNANFSEASGEYNAHTHNDFTSSTTNTFTIGDNGVGNKSYAIDNSFSTAPSLRYNLILERWQFANDASVFQSMVGTTDDAIAWTSGQVLIGNGTSVPVRTTLTAGPNITIANGPGSITISNTISGDITAVGAGCASGACWTNGVTTSGTTMAVWEGTTDNANDVTFTMPADPATNVTLQPVEQMVKGWVQYDQSGGTPVIADSFNVSGVDDSTAGVATVNWDTDFAAATYAVVAIATRFTTQVTAMTAGSVTIETNASTGTATDSDNVSVIAIGDQ